MKPRQNTVQEELLHYSIPGVSIGGGVSVGGNVSKFWIFYVKVLKISYFLNPLTELNYARLVRCWFKLLFSTIPISGHALEVKVTDWESLDERFMLQFLKIS